MALSSWKKRRSRNLDNIDYGFAGLSNGKQSSGISGSSVVLKSTAAGMTSNSPNRQRNMSLSLVQAAMYNQGNDFIIESPDNNSDNSSGRLIKFLFDQNTA